MQSRGPRSAIGRLAYADGKVYFLNDPNNFKFDTQSVKLQQMDVTLAVDCPSVMSVFAESFANWAINETAFGFPEDASPGHMETVYLSEGSTARLPWAFKAYRKVIQVDNTLVTLCLLGVK